MRHRLLLCMVSPKSTVGFGAKLCVRKNRLIAFTSHRQFGMDMQSASPTRTRYFGMSPRGEIADPKTPSNHETQNLGKQAAVAAQRLSRSVLLTNCTGFLSSRAETKTPGC